VTGIGPAEPAPPARDPSKPHPSNIAIPVSKLARLVATAARAPSVHNTQPWRFRASRDTIDLLADRSRKLPRIDPAGREMLISCGAALFGLRLAIRELGYLPDIQLLPDPTHTDLLARVRCGAAAPITPAEQQMLAAMPYRHTHRGPFTSDPLPRGLLAGLQHDALAEGATLVLVDQPGRASNFQPWWPRLTINSTPIPRCGPSCGAGPGHRAAPPVTASPPTPIQPPTRR
jgi:hypothetical protein